MTKQTTVPDETVLDIQHEEFTAALEQIQVAAALGMKIPAPVGSSVWALSVTCYDDNEYTIDLGIHASREDARAALRNWILWEYINTDSGPWVTDDLDPTSDEDYRVAADAYMSSESDSDVINHYFATSSDELSLTEIVITHGEPGYRSLADMGV